MKGVYIVLCTFANIEEARQIGTLAVEKQLAACVNILPSCESIYRWEGKIQQDKETLCIFKVKSITLEMFKVWLLEVHSYSVPEFLAFEVSDISGDYMKWLVGSGT